MRAASSNAPSGPKRMLYREFSFSLRSERRGIYRGNEEGTSYYRYGARCSRRHKTSSCESAPKSRMSLATDTCKSDSTLAARTAGRVGIRPVLYLDPGSVPAGRLPSRRAVENGPTRETRARSTSVIIYGVNRHEDASV